MRKSTLAVMAVAAMVITTLGGARLQATEKTDKALAPSIGDYACVTWSGKVNGRSFLGYLSAARQASGAVYVYYTLQTSGLKTVTGFGVVPGSMLQRRSDNALELAVDTSRVSGFTLQGGAGGPVRVLWKPASTIVTLNQGVAGKAIGRLAQITSGSWSSCPATVTGSVVGRTITLQQSGEMGVATKVVMEFHLGD